MFQSRPGSRNCSGTPEDPGPEPVIPAPAGFVYAPQMQGVHPPPVVGEDPFRVHVPAQHQGVINLNDDMPPMQNAPQGINIPGPPSQEGRRFQWQIPPPLPGQPLIQPPIPIQPPVPIQPPIPIQPPA